MTIRTSRIRKLGARSAWQFLLLATFCFGRQSAGPGQPSSIRPLSTAEVRQLQDRGRAGDPAAQLNLGRAYDDGNGVSQSDAQAVKWYKAAAEQGNAVAQDNLGLMFRAGRGVEQDKTEALRWYHKAAKQENPNAMFNLGTAYYKRGRNGNR